VHVSAPLQVPSPQKVQVPQSSAHRVQVSPISHTSLSQTAAQVPQSPGQLAQLSASVQASSPQPAQVPQSAAQVAQSSPPLHAPSPQ
jgi:hypothetical protein